MSHGHPSMAQGKVWPGRRGEGGQLLRQDARVPRGLWGRGAGSWCAESPGGAGSVKLLRGQAAVSPALERGALEWPESRGSPVSLGSG